MHNNLTKIFYFINEFIEDDINKLNKNISIIYRNYNTNINKNLIKKIKDFCKINKRKFYISYYYKLAFELNLDGIYIPAFDKNKIINAYFEAPKKGFNTELMGKDLLYWSSLLLNLSKKGLESRDILNKSNENEVKFLSHLEKLIDNKTTNADHMIAKFSKNENLNDLYDK